MSRIQRNSNYECLRLFCIFGIVCMHVFGTWKESVTGSNQALGIVINTLFNTGVSCFVLISGFFGVRFSFSKIARLWLRALVFSVVSFILLVACNVECFSVNGLVDALTPVYSRKYWYITAYIMLLLFADEINEWYGSKSQNQKKKVLTVILIIFCIIPSVINRDIMRDGGKGFFNMLLMYLVGRYIREYNIDKANSVKPILWKMVLVFGIGLALNTVTSFAKGKVGVTAPFARDCSIVIVLLSIYIFLLFSKIKMDSPLVNNIAKHTLTIYLFEGAIRKILIEELSLEVYSNSAYLPLLVLTETVAICIVCVLTSVLYEILFARAEQKVLSMLKAWGIKVWGEIK